MNKKLFTQIKNEWRSNLWLVTELLLVSVVLWYIVDYMYVQTSIYNEPRGLIFLIAIWCKWDVLRTKVQTLFPIRQTRKSGRISRNF